MPTPLPEFDVHTLDYLAAAGVEPSLLRRVEDALRQRVEALAEVERLKTKGTAEQGVELMGTLMQQSARDLAHTNNQIIASLKADKRELQMLVIDFANAIDAALVIDRKTEDRLAMPMAMAQIQRDAVMREGSLS